MDAHVRVAGGDEFVEVADLWESLLSERSLAGAVRAVRTLPEDGELGGTVDMLAVALGSGSAGVALARCLLAWLRTRRSAVAVTVKTKTGIVTVKASDIDRDDVLPLLERVLRNGND